MTAESRPALVLDACVMMSGLLRPLLLDLAATGLFAPLWTYKIGQEWQRNAARLWQIEPQVLESEWQHMQERFPQADMGDVTEHEAPTPLVPRLVSSPGTPRISVAQNYADNS